MPIIVNIKVEVDSDHEDPNHPMGITNEAFERITGADGGEGLFLGDVLDVTKDGES